MQSLPIYYLYYMKTQILQVLRICVMVLIIICIGNTISLLSYVVGRVLVACIECGITLFIGFANILKDNILVLSMWIMVFSQLKNQSIWEVMYRAIAPLIWGNHQCSICLNDRCDYSLHCGHTYHWRCL